MSISNELDFKKLEFDLKSSSAMTPSVAVYSCMDDKFQGNLKYLESCKCNLGILKAQLLKQIKEDNEDAESFGLDSSMGLETGDMRTLLEFLNKSLKDNTSAPTFEDLLAFIYSNNTQNKSKFAEVVFALNSSGYNPVVALANSKYKTLNKFCIDLVVKASNNKIDPLIGREKEVERMIEILSHYKKKNPLLVGEAGVGKCLGKGTEVRMFDGTLKKVEDIVVGDLVMGPDSTNRLVTGLARGREEMFRVDQKYGISYEVNKSHILSLKHWKKGLVNIEVSEFIGKNKTFKREAKGWKSGFDLPYKETIIPPYLLGIWLGYGHSRDARITTSEPEIVGYMQEYCNYNDLTLTNVGSAGKASTYSITGNGGMFRLQLDGQGVLGNKHIPEVYLMNSLSERLELLAGLLDTDGYLDRGQGFEITQKNKTLAVQIQELAQSVGLRCSRREVVKTCVNNGVKGIYHLMYITGKLNIIPNKVSRRKVLKEGENRSNTEISLTSIGDGDYYGFTLKGVDRLFLLKDGTVTHNTAIVDGLASRIASGNVPGPLKGAKIFSTSIAAIMAGTKFRGDVEEKMQELLAELKKHEEDEGVVTILFIDEMHQIIGAGTNSGGSDGSSIANIIKPQLASGELSLIGATTEKEYKRTIQKDEALNRRMQVVRVDQPSDAETIEIIRKGIAPVLNAYHGVRFSESVIESAVRLSSKYITDKAQPDKAISLLDSIGARLRTTENRDIARVSDVEKLISVITGTPVSAFKQKVGVEEYIDIEGKLNSIVFGQTEAIKKISEIYERSKAGLSEVGQPIGSVLAVGPTGSGKSQVAKSLADITESYFLKINMGEYTEEHSVAKLFGAPPGYIGHSDGGLLTSAIRKNPHAVILLDEIEKAHVKVFEALLGIIDGAKMVSGEGDSVDFSNTFIFMTSNVGMASAAARKTIDLASNLEIAQKAKTAISLQALQSTFSPEFRNKLSGICEFKSLGEAEIRKVTDKFLKEAQNRLKDRKGIEIEFTESVYEFINKNGFDKLMGARPIKKLIESKIVDILIRPILKGEIKIGSVIQFDIVDNDVVYSIKKEVRL
jgi:ATP-dependent Clp protease ATP-binding subunit ClpA